MPDHVQFFPGPPSPGQPRLEILYDGARLAFVDIDAPGYEPEAHAGVTYRQAMGRIHAITAESTVLRDVEVFRRAYSLVGLGWL